MKENEMDLIDWDNFIEEKNDSEKIDNTTKSSSKYTLDSNGRRMINVNGTYRPDLRPGSDNSNDAKKKEVKKDKSKSDDGDER